MPARLAPVALAAALGLVSLAACGSDPKAAYIKQGDAICSQADRQLHALPQPSVSGQTPRQAAGTIAAYLDRVTSLTDQTFRRLRELKRPSVDQSRLEDWFARSDRAIAELRALAATAHTGNLVAIQSKANQLSQALNATGAGSAARAYGFKVCGTAGGG